MSGWSHSVHRVFAAVNHIQHARRHAGFQRQLDQLHGDQRVLLEGLSTKVLPVAMAIGNIHSGIIAGKLNG